MSQPQNDPSNGVPALKVYKPVMDNNWLKMLIYGEPGAGKTTLAATAAAEPTMNDVLFINIEGGIMSITDPAILGAKVLPDVVDFNKFSDLEDIFWFLAKGQHKYKTVVVDSLSELQKYNLDKIVGDQIGNTSKTGAKRTNADDIWQEDYGTSTQQMRRVVRKFRDLPMHVIFTCHDASGMDKDKTERVFPALTPKLRTSVMGYVDVVGFLYTQEIEDADGEKQILRRLLTQPYGKWMAKDRTPGGRLGTVLDNPTMPEIMKRLRGGK